MPIDVEGISYINDIEKAEAVAYALQQLEVDVLHSPEYKLLYGKTQMFYDGFGRSRGGHSHNIGITSANMAEKAFEKIFSEKEQENPELYAINLRIQRIIGHIMGYSHDLGHTPLGHDGESVLDSKLEELSAKNSEMRAEVSEQRRSDFAGVKVVADAKTAEKFEGQIEEGQEYDYETFQEIKRGDVGIGYEHNEYSAQIFIRILRNLKERVATTEIVRPEVAEQIAKIDETKFVTAILAHSRSRFPTPPRDIMAQIVRQADKVEYMNFDFEEYAEMVFFPLERTEENAEQHDAFISLLSDRIKASKKQFTVEQVMEYMKLSGQERRELLEESMIEEAFVGLDGREPKGEITDNMRSMDMARLCAEFKDDAIFYIPDDGKRGLITGNNVERQEVVLDKLLQYYVDHPDKIPTEPIAEPLSKLKKNEDENLVVDGELVVAFDPKVVEGKCDYEKLKVFLSSLTNARCEKLYQQLVQERIQLGPNHGIEPVTKEDIKQRRLKTLSYTKSADQKRENGKKSKYPYSLSRSKKVEKYMSSDIKERIDQNRQKHEAEAEQDQSLYEEMVKADELRQNAQQIPSALESAILISTQDVTSEDIGNIAKEVSKGIRSYQNKNIQDKEAENDGR